MSDRRTVSARAGKDADFAVIIEDDSLAPLVRAGGRA